jgi:hypothetical protein
MTNSFCYNQAEKWTTPALGRALPSTSLRARSRPHTLLRNDYGFRVSQLYTGPRVIGVGTGCADQLAGQCAPKGTLLRYCQRRTHGERPGFGSILSDGNVCGCAAIDKGKRRASCCAPASGRTDRNIRHRFAAPFEMVGIILRKRIPRFVFFPLMEESSYRDAWVFPTSSWYWGLFARF